MLEFNFTPYPSLITSRLILREVTTDDANEVLFLRSDETVMKYIDRPRAASLDEALEFIKMITTAITTNSDITWGISVKDDPKLIGYLGYWRMNKEHYRGEIGYALHPVFHGKGIMQEAIQAVLDYGFKTMKLHSVEANVNPENQASIKLLERNGFVREAYFKEDYFYNGKFLDSAIYSLLTPVK